MIFIMMKRVFLIFLCFIFAQAVYALDVVYPKKNEITVNSPTTIFVGSAVSPLTVNGKDADIHPNGGFAYFVNLDEGENVFELKDEQDVKIYKIIRKSPNNSSNYFNKLIEYGEKKYFTVKDDNSPLRSTPVDCGINRMAHLQKDIMLIVDGEKGNFYRVFLNDNKYAWIDKKYVSPTEEFENALISSFDFEEDDNYYNVYYHINKKVPYEIIEGSAITVNFYNTNNKSSFQFPYLGLSGSRKLIGYSGEYQGDDFVLKVRKPVYNDKHKPLKNLTITVDAGHGGSEIGAIGCLGDREKDIVLNVSKYLQHELKKLGANVVMTRDEDVNVPLYDRVNIANDNDSSIFVSIHANALPNTMNPLEHRGTSIYYYYNEAEPLAKSILKSMTEQLQTQDDKIRQGSFAVVRNTKAVSVLIEIAYLINPEDNALLIDTEFQKQCAKSIADGIANYIIEK